MTEQRDKAKKLFKKLALNYDPSVEQFLNITSGEDDSKPILKDSSSKFYSVYRNGSFDPNKWEKSLLQEQISVIEKHTLHTFNSLIEISNH